MKQVFLIFLKIMEWQLSKKMLQNKNIIKTAKWGSITISAELPLARESIKAPPSQPCAGESAFLRSSTPDPRYVRARN